MIRTWCHMPMVGVRACITLPLSVERAWSHLQHFKVFATSDVFHQHVRVHADMPDEGVGLTIEHCWLGLRVTRHGRILRWRPPTGYAFSDLSQRGARVGFPHVFIYHLQKTGDRNCRLTMTVRGRWTATWLPAWMVRLWLWWVMAKVKHTVEVRMLKCEIQARRTTPSASSERRVRLGTTGCRVRS